MFGNHIASEGFIFRMYNMNYQNSKEKKNKQKMDISTSSKIHRFKNNINRWLISI